MRVIPEISVILPNTLAAVDVVHVGVFVAPVQFTLPIRGISCVITTDHAVIEFASNIAVSCGSGTYQAHHAPFVARNQLPAVDQLADAHDWKYWLIPVVNVIPEFPPQSHELPVMADRFQDPAPAPVTS